jgi:hypothetical protein
MYQPDSSFRRAIRQPSNRTGVTMRRQIEPYQSMEACTIKVDGQPKRGVRVFCVQCSERAEIVANTHKGSGSDDDVVERILKDKFEKLGWKMGKNLHHNLCPEHAKKENAIMVNNTAKPPQSEKVVLMNSAAAIVTPKTAAPKPLAEPTPSTPRGPTRDEKRIIFQKIDEMYVGETVGYSGGWSDKKIAADLAVPVAWVSAIREENFGPDIDEESATVLADAKALLSDVRGMIQGWATRADELEKSIAAIRQRK